MEPHVAIILDRQLNGIGPQHVTQTVAAALTMASGKQWASMCCWCVEQQNPSGTRGAHRVAAGHGECDTCSYSGRDCLVVAPE
jgi:hypothetical protein